VHIANFDPATAEGGFPVSLQGVNLTRDVGQQFFGLGESPIDALPVTEVIKSKTVWGLIAAGVGVGAIGGYMYANRRR
jgi:hypothetical protein